MNQLFKIILHENIYTFENQVIKGSDKDYYYINVSVNNKFYVYIINDNSCIYKNVTNMFEAKDTDSLYNSKSSLIKNNEYVYLKENDDESAIEQVANISNDNVSFTDGEIIKGLWK